MNVFLATEKFWFSRQGGARLLILCIAILFEGMSLSSINVQLADIQRDLGLRTDELQLVTSIFFVTYAGFLLIGGKCADQFGSRRIFLAGIAIFGLGSLTGGFAQGSWQLVITRAVQGTGVALTAPAAVALIVSEFPSRLGRNRAMGVFSAMGAVGFCLGVVIGGALTDMFGWRSGFLVFVPLSAIVLAISPWLLSAAPRRSEGTIAWRQALLVTIGLVSVVHEAGRIGMAPTIEVLTVIGGGLLFIGVFLTVQDRTRNALIPFQLLGDARIAGAAIALGGGFAAITGAMFIVATALQNNHGYSPFSAGLAFLPQGLAVGFLSTPAARLADRWSNNRRLLFTGLGILTVGQLLYVASAASGYADRLLPATLLVGAGIAALYPAATLIASTAAKPDEQGITSGLLITSQQLGSALGVAMVSSIKISTSGNVSGNLAELYACAALAFLTLAVCTTILLMRPTPDELDAA